MDNNFFKLWNVYNIIIIISIFNSNLPTSLFWIFSTYKANKSYELPWNTENNIFIQNRINYYSFHILKIGYFHYLKRWLGSCILYGLLFKRHIKCLNNLRTCYICALVLAAATSIVRRMVLKLSARIAPDCLVKLPPYFLPIHKRR